MQGVIIMGNEMDIILSTLCKCGVEETQANTLVDETRWELSEEYKNNNSFEYAYNERRI